jgi:hypothetical protein
MRILLASLLALAPASQDAEAKKTRIGEIMKKVTEERKAAGGDREKEAQVMTRLRPLVEEMQRLAAEVAGPDRDKQSALIRELGEKYVPEEFADAQLRSNERNSAAALMWIGTAQAQFRAEDPDGDGVANYWVADVSGLHRLLRKNGRAVALLENGIAQADARPALALDEEGAPNVDRSLRLQRVGPPAPRTGYHFVAPERYHDAVGVTIRYDSGGGRNPVKFGFCAYPTHYGKTGRMTFLKSEAATPSMWKKDTGGRPPAVFPFDPAKDGWQAYD